MDSKLISLIQVAGIVTENWDLSVLTDKTSCNHGMTLYVEWRRHGGENRM